jgi:hypothetical protein
METIQDFTIHFHREIRTSSSEQYSIFYLNNNNSVSESTAIGTLHIHIGRHISGILVLFDDFGNREISLIVEEIRDQILSSLEGTVLDPTGTYIEVYSNSKRIEDLNWDILISKQSNTII